VQQTVSSLESQQNDLRAASGNRLAVFGGNKTIQLAGLVERNLRRFEHVRTAPVHARASTGPAAVHVSCPFLPANRTPLAAPIASQPQAFAAAARSCARPQPPIGPMGNFLSLTDDRWKTAAESMLGAHLEKWIVHSRKDEKVGAPC
jgi:hypothetical protein